MNVIVDTIQWTYSERADKTFPIKLRILHKGDTKYFPVIVDGRRLTMSKEDWNEMQISQNLKGEKKRIKDIITRFEGKALQVTDETTHYGKRPFSFQAFTDKFSSKEETIWFFRAFDKYLEDLNHEGRIGTFVSYRNARRAFFGFTKKDINPEYITVSFLRRFEQYLREHHGASINTIAIYIRAIKVIYNVLASTNPYLRESYPFAVRRSEKQKYQIRTEASKKGNAMTLAELRAFVQTNPKVGSATWEAKQFWLLSFYCQGMNFKDITTLLKSDVHSDQIGYVRGKTKNTELHQVRIWIPMTATIRSIIDSLPASSGPFQFNILNEGMSLEKRDSVARQMIKTTNKWLKRLCQESGLPEITTYWARHTYASLLKDRGISVDFIRELLGHSDVKTTERYLRRFDQDRVRLVNQGIEDLIHS